MTTWIYGQSIILKVIKHNFDHRWHVREVKTMVILITYHIITNKKLQTYDPLVIYQIEHIKTKLM